jgi:hypothetical protein
MAKTERKKGGPGPRGAPRPKTNPFELKTAKKKFDIIGRKIKGQKVNVVAARSEANDKVRCCAPQPPAAAGRADARPVAAVQVSDGL